MNEPSVFDYIKAQISLYFHQLISGAWVEKVSQIQHRNGEKESSEKLPGFLNTPDSMITENQIILREEKELDKNIPTRIPWKIITAILLAVFAQIQLEPPNRSIFAAISLYAISAFLLVASIITSEWTTPEIIDRDNKPMPMTIRKASLYVSIPLLSFAFLTFSGNRFTLLNLTLWFAGLMALIWAFWLTEKRDISVYARMRTILSNGLKINITLFGVLLILVFCFAAFFRFYQLEQIPGEMFSDHAEKLLDVGDILNGQYSIFFPRNTGREAIQMYVTAAIAILCNTGLTFISLKIGTTLIGFMTLPYIYLLGKELKNKWVGLLAVVLSGMAYWPNVISRIGLRFPLYPVFVAPVLFYIIRGLRNKSRNDFILAGIFLGLSLHGYSPSRFLPFVVVAAVLIYMLHSVAKGNRTQVFWGLVIVAVVSFVVFLPLFRYILEDPQGFSSRAFSRLGELERPLPGPALMIFLSNFWRASIMMFYDNGSIWVHSIPGRPALEVISAALFFSGLIFILVRYIRRRHWEDLFLLVSIPLLMMPSILSIAFPDENPSLNRTGGAIVPVFILAAIALEGLISTIRNHWRSSIGTTVAGIITIALLGFSVSNNVRLVFSDFNQQFMAGAWNTSDMGEVIRGFANSIGSPENAYVVPYPYWVDTRLVGINAGYPQRDYALWPESFNETLVLNDPQLFILNTEDRENLEILSDLYPVHTLYRHEDQYDGKDFWLFFVPGE